MAKKNYVDLSKRIENVEDSLNPQRMGKIIQVWHRPGIDDPDQLLQKFYKEHPEERREFGEIPNIHLFLAPDDDIKGCGIDIPMPNVVCEVDYFRTSK